MSEFTISFQDVEQQFEKKGNFSFMYPPLNTHISVSFQDCNNDIERFVKVIKTIRLYNKKMILIRNDSTNDIVKTTHNNANYYKNVLSLKQLIKTNIDI